MNSPTFRIACRDQYVSMFADRKGWATVIITQSGSTLRRGREVRHPSEASAQKRYAKLVVEMELASLAEVS